MATQEEKDNLRATIVTGVRRFTVAPTGETSTEFRDLNELRGIRADLEAEDLVADGRRSARTIRIGTSKGIGE